MILKDLASIDEFRQVVELERLIWGSTYDDVVPVPVFVITVKRGAVLIGAFADSGEMIGFVYSIAGLRRGRPMQWSHMLGVRPEHRNGGLGRRLKLEQRARTLAAGLDLIEWTFDPLQAANAHLNLSSLGAIAREYEENIYGESSSPLHRGSPTDRFVVEWWVASPHVEGRLGGAPHAAARFGDARPINATKPWKDWRTCEAVDLGRSDPAVAVEIPTGFTEMLGREPELARDWRRATREIFQAYFSRGYVAVDFVLDREARLGRYVLTDRTASAPTLAGMGGA